MMLRDSGICKPTLDGLGSFVRWVEEGFSRFSREMFAVIGMVGIRGSI
jgi:hypothetical protein